MSRAHGGGGVTWAMIFGFQYMAFQISSPLLFSFTLGGVSGMGRAATAALLAADKQAYYEDTYTQRSKGAFPQDRTGGYKTPVGRKRL